MSWEIQLDANAEKTLQHIDKSVQIRITDFLLKLSHQENPRLYGKALKGKHTGTWRYRVGDYRLICAIQDQHLVVLVLALGHRKAIY